MPRKYHILQPFSIGESDYDYNFECFDGILIVIRYIVAIVMDVFEMRIDDRLIIYDTSSRKRFDRIDRRIREPGLMVNSCSSIDERTFFATNPTTLKHLSKHKRSKRRRYRNQNNGGPTFDDGRLCAESTARSPR